MRAFRFSLLAIVVTLLGGCGGTAMAFRWLDEQGDPAGGEDAGAGMENDAGLGADAGDEPDAGPPPPSGPLLTSLALWLVADDVTTVPDDTAQRVATWPSRYGPARSFTQPTATARPTLVSTAVNDHPAVQFDELHHLLTDEPLPIGSTTIFFVLERDASAPAQVMHLLTDCTATSSITLGPAEAALSVSWDILSAAPEVNLVLPASLAGWHILTIAIDESGIGVDVDGDSVLTDDSAIPPGATPALVLGDLGGRCGIEGLIGSVAEVLVYEARLARPSLDAVNDYLRARYAIEP